jgi:8-oxo-dGTP pyrophosphatase MutT (NUDIX family)
LNIRRMPIFFTSGSMVILDFEIASKVKNRPYFYTMDEHKNPWQILSEKELYDNKWINVTEYDVINPGGGKSIYGKIHFKNLAIGIIALDEQFNIYLVGQFRFAINEYSWEIPEGGGSMNTDPLESAKRELAEETGLVAHEWTVLSKLHLSNSVSDEQGLVFLARDLEQHTPMPEETEQLMIKKLPFEEAWGMVENGVITDSLSIIAILKVKLMISDGKL